MSLDALAAKLEQGTPLDREDGLALFSEPDLLAVAALANRARERRFGDRTTYNRNLHINPTNVCVAGCRLCSFSRKRPDEPGAYTLTLEQAWDKLRARLRAGERVTEVHVVAGLNPELPFP